MNGRLPKVTEDYLRCGAVEGQRNEQLFAASCQCRDASLSQDETVSLLIGRAVQDGLPEREATATIRSAWTAPAREPIHGKTKHRPTNVINFPHRRTAHPTMTKPEYDIEFASIGTIKSPPVKKKSNK